MNNIFYLTQYNGKDYHAGSKGQDDCLHIVGDFGFAEIHNTSQDNSLANDGTNHAKEKNFNYYAVRLLNGIKAYLNLKKYSDNWIFCQYPDFSPKYLYHVVDNFFLRNHIVYIVHDLRFWREKDCPQKLILREKKLLNHADILIVHNEHMKNRLINEGITHPYMIPIEIFDYLGLGNLKPKKFLKKVIFAGNLRKSEFIHKFMVLPRNYDISLYGIGMTKDDILPDKVEYHGSYAPDILPGMFDGGFGLVWDGCDINKCGGILGEYMRYNNPHKFSLYLASGLPVIVWSQSAIADVVKKYNIGYCIDSLEDINDIMERITLDDYKGMLNNIQPLQDKVIHGDFLKDSINKSLEIIRNAIIGD